MLTLELRGVGIDKLTATVPIQVKESAEKRIDNVVTKYEWTSKRGGSSLYKNSREFLPAGVRIDWGPNDEQRNFIRLELNPNRIRNNKSIEQLSRMFRYLFPKVYLRVTRLDVCIDYKLKRLDRFMVDIPEKRSSKVILKNRLESLYIGSGRRSHLCVYEKPDISCIRFEYRNKTIGPNSLPVNLSHSLDFLDKIHVYDRKAAMGLDGIGDIAEASRLRSLTPCIMSIRDQKYRNHIRKVLSTVEVDMNKNRIRELYDQELERLKLFGLFLS